MRPKAEVQENFVGGRFAAKLPCAATANYSSYVPAQLTHQLPDALSLYKFCFMPS
jgi:hypothetical protein